ncbi:MAG: M20 family metallopeptidase [Bacillota bacterium]|jgi:amidohydrolase
MSRRDEWRKKALASIDAAREDLLAISHDIFEYAELAFEEFRSAERLRSFLRERGFRISDVEGLPTAFIAEKGTGSPVVAFMAEYDALPEIGHACGHNIIAAAAVGAGLGVASFIEESGGTVRVIGTPAEEGGGGKIIMVDKGVFDDVDAAMIVHPSGAYMADDHSYAIQGFDIQFIGKAAHAASGPQHGINALDAAVEFLVSLNAFREHMTDDGRIHAIITHGGSAVNVIPERSELKVAVRATTKEYLDELIQQVERKVKGASISAGCQYSIKPRGLLCREINVNRELSRLFEENFKSLGIPVAPRGDSKGSTDVGNVSHVVPTIQAYVGIGADVCHTVEFREASISQKGDEAVIDGAKVMALTAADILSDETVLERMRSSFRGE